MTYENSTSAAAFGVVAKHPECILTPPGTPISGIFSCPSALTMSLVVPSPPAYTITSTCNPVSCSTRLVVSAAEDVAGLFPTA